MKRSETYLEFYKSPISAGSIYLKKTEEEETIPDKCYKYLYYFFCCIYIYDN